MKQVTCFSKDVLRRFLLGELPEATSDAVAIHVEACADCESTVSMLDRETDTLIEALRTPVADDEPASAYRLAAKLAKSKWRDASSDSAVVSLSKVPKLRDYELLEPLARGGMGTLYRARHARLNRQVALKVLPGRWLKDPAAVARFEREMQAVGSLHHPAIVQATDGGEADGVHFLVMELIDGFDGGSLVNLVGPLPIADACEIARQTADGMAYVHQQGIIHRDLKPSNLMVTRSGDVKVLDLGLARLVDEQLAGDELTTVGQLMGTLDYMSPEQLEDSHDVDERADLYSLGATLYKLLTGHSPHLSDSSEPFLSKLRRIASEPPTPLKERRDDAPEELCGLVDSLLSRNPDDRPDSMDSVCRSLAAFTGSADLAKRTKQAAKIRSQRKDSVPPHPLIATSALDAAGSPGRTDPRQNRTTRFLAGAVATLALLAAAFGILVTVQTDAGQLVIETAEPGVEVRILKADQPYRQLTLSQKPNSLKLGAGDYRIEIVSEADGLEIENGRYTLKRGETWLAKIVHRKEEMVVPITVDPTSDLSTPESRASATSEMPTYEGKTFADWLSLLRTERSGAQVYEACNALRKLDSGDETETIDALLMAARYHSAGSYHQVGESMTVRIWDSIRRVLAVQDQNRVIVALTRSLAQDDDVDVPFVLEYLTTYSERLQSIATDRLFEQLRRIAADPESPHQVAGLQAFCAVGPQESANRLLVGALENPQTRVRLFAAETLIDRKIDAAAVVAALRDVVLSADLSGRAEAAWRLGELGSEAKAAVPELVRCVHDDDLAAAFAGVYRSPKRTLGVKDAAIDALGRIGDESVAPLLIDEWNQRAFGDRPSIRAGSEEVERHGLSDPHDEEEWVADAIERLLDRRPKKTRRPDRTYGMIWSTGRQAIDTLFRTGLDFRYRRNTDSVLDSAKMLLPLAQPFELEQALSHVRIAEGFPDKQALDLEIRLIDMLAQFANPKDVLRALYSRRSLYVELIKHGPRSEDPDATLQAYRTLAAKILRDQEDWDSAYAPFVMELLDQRYFGAAVSFLDLIDQFSPTQQVDGVIKLFYLIGVSGDNLGDADAILKTWISTPANREAIQKRLKMDSSRPWLDLVVAIYRWGGDDALADAIVKQRFAEDSIKRVDLLNELIALMNDRPDLSELIIELLQDPSLDEPAKSLVADHKTIQKSFRAEYIANVLPAITEPHRPRFLPLLQKLSETGNNGEPTAALRLLDQWK